ncbi:MAG TPA: YhcH/YjgK/YiaL family protein [Candidatus Nanoarchaeia archaeon]|nr:YhcH/YjgK/YiaL family protein [Candidatus Nanoarchaeia archaeon]
MHNLVRIEGERLYLRTLREEDASAEYLSWLNDPEVKKYLETPTTTETGQIREYIQKQREDPNSFFVGIFEKQTDQHIGNVKLEPINWKEKTAVFGTLIGDKNYWGKGYGQEATRLMVNYGFQQLGLKKITLGVIDYNTRAINCYKKVGFAVKEIKTKSLEHEGKRYDNVMMEIENPDGESGNILCGQISTEENAEFSGAIKEAVDYLRKTDFVSLENGKRLIRGENLFAVIANYKTESKSNKKAEVHRSYIDLQYVISGEEIIGAAPLALNPHPSEEYDSNKDAAFYETLVGETELRLKPGEYAFFFPEDIHRPGCSLTEPTEVRKAVVKIAVDSLGREEWEIINRMKNKKPETAHQVKNKFINFKNALAPAEAWKKSEAEQMLKTVALVQARMSATRLPGKVLMTIQGKTLLEIEMERLQQAARLNEIVIATTTNPADDAIEALAKKKGWACFRGDENDVLDRFYQAAKEFKADIIVRITGDCPFHDPRVVDELVDFYLKNIDKYDYASNVEPATYPDGMDLWIFPFRTLEKAWKEAKLKSEREHVCPYIWKNPQLFRIGHLSSPVDYSQHRWTVDNAADFEVVKTIYEALHREGEVFHMEDVLQFLEKNPHLAKLNKEEIRDAGYLKSLREDEQKKREKGREKKNMLGNKGLKILGLSLGQLTTACLMIDGKVIACASEERFTGIKNDMAYPKNAIEYCLKEGQIEGKDLDKVAIASLHIPADYQATKKFCTSFSMQDSVREQKEFWYPKFYEGKNLRWIDVFKDKLNFQQYPGPARWEEIDFTDDKTQWETYKPFIHKTISQHIGVNISKITHIEHHTGHAAYAYWASPFRGEDCLILTADAYGDGLSATISIVKDGKVERILASKNFNLARLYRYVTLLLGMKPDEHEYKVMGLAPYAKPQTSQRPYEIFKKGLYVDGLDFAYYEKPTDHYFYFKELLEGCRFDGIAGGLQKYVEEILTQWVRNIVKATEIHNIVFSGGVSLNIKASMEITKLPEVQKYFVCASGGDESIAVGACYHTTYEYCLREGLKTEEIIHPLSNVYLGPEFNDEHIDQVIKEKWLETRYKISRNSSSADVAKLLAEGKVIGRCCGRMEFGARALGNRSIMANPKIPGIVQKINEKIKNRDFWMPFTPSMLFERTNDYLINPKNLFAPFMTLAFETTAKAREDLPGALHPADFTARPQMVRQEDNPEYYELIKAFEKITGVGALLNTSFNLHGYPVILSPEDAIHVMENSDIDGVLLNKILIMKTDR